MQAVWHRVAEPEGLLRVDTGTLSLNSVCIAPALKVVIRLYACSDNASALVAAGWLHEHCASGGRPEQVAVRGQLDGEVEVMCMCSVQR